MPQRVVVIGVGNQLRGDDAAGLAAVAQLRTRKLAESITIAMHEGEAIALHELWDGADALVLVDTVSSGAAPGTVHRIDASGAALPAALQRGSSHAIGVADAIELARVLGTLPRRVIVYGIEGAGFELGAALSDDVAAALDELIDALRDEALALRVSTA